MNFFKILLISMVYVSVVFVGTTFPKAAYAAGPLDACYALKGSTYVYFIEGPAYTNRNAAFGGRVTFDSTETQGYIHGTIRSVYTYNTPSDISQNTSVPGAASCAPKYDGSAICEIGNAQQIMNFTCTPDYTNSKSNSLTGILFFNNAGMDGGSVRFFIYDNGSRLLTYTSIPDAKMPGWWLKLPSLIQPPTLK